MKKLTVVIAILLVAIMLFTLCACNGGQSGETGGDQLKIYNWEDYIDQELLDEFAEYYKSVTGRSLSITYTTYDTNETMMTKVLKGDANVDLICPSEYSIEKLLRAGCLVNMKDLYTTLKPQLDELGLTFEGMSSLGMGDGNIESGVMSMIRNMFSSVEGKDGNTYDMTQYMVPYMWGTLGILYNTSIISQEELDEYGWGVLWNVQQNPELENMILMKDSVRDSYAAAVLYMHAYNLLPQGYEDWSIQDLINCTDMAMLDKAEEVLTDQRDHISGYEVDFGKNDMINEIVYADFAWSGDALWAIEEGGYDEESDTYQLGYYIPTTGSNVWYDGWCIPTSVNNSLAAMMFIEYMTSPMSSARNSMQIGYTSACSKELMQNDADVLAFLEENEYCDDDSNGINDYFENVGRYPDFVNEGDTYYGILGVMRDYDSMNETVVQMWQRAKSGGEVNHTLWYILVVLAAAIILALGAYALTQLEKRRPRKLKQ